MERKFHVSNRKHISRVRTSRRRPGCIRLFVCPTTGGRLEISVSPRETVFGLKVALARKLRILPAKITLLYKDKVLKDGCIQDYQIPDDSHVTLLPNMESGLSLHHTDKSIVQALENLTETQVSDFLSGRSPLMLAMHMGENMVFVQLQLSMLQGQGQCPPQARPSGSPATPGAAAVISQTGLSPSTLAEATRCLSQRLQKLHGINVGSKLTSSRSAATSVTPPVTTETPDPPAVAASRTLEGTSSQTIFQHLQTLPTLSESSSPTPPPSPGAVINSMKHIGRGIYTGTFQGTLDPSLQDGNGQPRRSVSTILHILNDLLVAAPQSPAPSRSPAPSQSPGPSQGQGQTSASVQMTCPPLTPALSLTPPPSPVSKFRPVCEGSPKDENSMLRDKMQRVQMMLAQRKEQRRSRRETLAPYTNQRSLQKITLANISSSLSASLSAASTSVCMAARATSSAATDGTDVSQHPETSSDPSNNYCKPNIEQDSLAV